VTARSASRWHSFFIGINGDMKPELSHSAGYNDDVNWAMFRTDPASIAACAASPPNHAKGLMTRHHRASYRRPAVQR
jgi:hypothetical protein